MPPRLCAVPAHVGSQKLLSALTRARAAACDAVARFVADDALRAAVLGLPSERVALVQGVTQLTAATWSQEEDPSLLWLAVSVSLRGVKKQG